MTPPFSVSGNTNWSNYKQVYPRVFGEIGQITMKQYGYGNYGYDSDMMIASMAFEFGGALLGNIFELAGSSKGIHNNYDGRGTSTIADEIKKLETKAEGYKSSIDDLEGLELTWSDNNPPTIEASKYSSFANSADIENYNKAVNSYNEPNIDGLITEKEQNEQNEQNGTKTKQYLYKGIAYTTKEAAEKVAIADIQSNAKTKADKAITNINESLKAYKTRLETQYNETQKKIEKLEQQQAKGVSSSFKSSEIGNNVFSDDVFKRFFTDNEGNMTSQLNQTPNADDRAKLLNTIIKKYAIAPKGDKGEKLRDQLSEQARSICGNNIPADLSESFKENDKKMLEIILQNKTRAKFGA